MDAPPIIPRCKFVGVVHGPLEHGAVNDAQVPFVAPRDDDHRVTTLEPVVVAHERTITGGHTAWK